MPVNFDPNMTLDTLAKLYGYDSEVHKAALKMQAEGFVFEEGTFELILTAPGVSTKNSFKSKVMLQSLINKTTQKYIIESTLVLIAEWLDEAYQAFFGEPAYLTATLDNKGNVPPPLVNSGKEAPFIKPPKKYYLQIEDKGNDILTNVKALRALFSCPLEQVKALVVGKPPIIVAKNLSEKDVNACLYVFTADSPSTKVTYHEMDGVLIEDLSKVPDYKVDYTSLKSLYPSKNWDDGNVVPDLSVIKPKGKLTMKTADVVAAKSWAENSMPGVISLQNADKLGQLVKGSGPGSVYKVIALNDRIKLAMLMQKDEISFRAESPYGFTDVEKNRFIESGFEDKGAHVSIHFKPGSVPKARILGAVMLGLGFTFTEQVSSIKQVEAWG